MQSDDVLSTRPATARVDPVRILEVELSSSLTDVEPAWDPRGRLYERALVLTRLHDEPLGLITLRLERGRLAADELFDRLWAEISVDAKRHLSVSDRIELTEEAPARNLQSTVSLPPVCQQERRRFLTSASPITVLIPSHERPERLTRCLNSVLACEYPIDRVKILIVDNAPKTDGTRLTVDSFADRCDIRYLREDVPGSASARNRGLREVQTEVVVMTDDDVVVDRHWLTEIARAFAAWPDAASVSGLIVPSELDTAAQVWFEQWGGWGRGFIARAFDLRAHWPDGAPLHPWSAGPFGNGNNLAFRTAAIRAIGGFDPALGNGTPALGGVDTEIMLRTVLNGYTAVYEPRAIVHHAHRRDYEALKRQIYAYGAGLTAVWLKTLLTNPKLSVDFARKIPRGLYFALSPRSAKNARKLTDYPRELTLLELRGMLYGPIGYARSRRKYGPHRVPRVSIPPRRSAGADVGAAT